MQQILTYSQKKDYHFQAITPHPVIDEVLRMLRASLPTTIDIQVDLDEQCGTILADPGNIHQIIMNLCTNSLRAMKDQKGTLSIRLHGKDIGGEEAMQNPEVPAGSFVVLSVSDTGSGMDRATREQIFEPFFSTRKFGEGTGMGLAVVYGIIQNLNGFISVESVPRKRSTFHVYIPKLHMETTSSHESVPEGIKADAPPLTGSERILVVDDEPLLVDIHKTRLEESGYTVTVTTESREALEIFSAHPDQFDLLLTDQIMPGLSGVELCRPVLEIKPDMATILCTGHSDIVSEQSALAMGIKGFVAKPVNGNNLLARVREVFDEKKE